MKVRIEKGHTNISYHDYDNNKFIQEKIYTGLNHITKYENLFKFDFVPRLINNSEKEVAWEWIDKSVELWNPSNEDLQNLAKILLIIHNSKIELAPFLIKKRIKEYQKNYNQKKLKIDIIDKSYKKINKILKYMDKTTPIHGDLWQSNILKRENDNKLFLIDWEYSHMGDKHFELAYLIESFELNSNQEQILLSSYKNYDEKILRKHKFLVHYLIVLWLHTHEKLPFSDEDSIKKLEAMSNEGI